MSRIRKIVPSLIFLLLLVSAAAAPTGVPFAYAANGVSITECRLLLPDAEFLKADGSEGIQCELWTPTDTELVYYGTDDGETISKKTKLVLEPQNKAQPVPFNATEVGNRYEIRVKTTLTMYVLRYRSETDENLNFLGAASFDGRQYFEGKIDGGIPKIAKNSLRTVLKENRWELSFTAEDPSSDAHYFWAQSGLKQIKVVKKVYPTPDSEAVYETVKDGGTGADLVTVYEGAGEGKAPLKRTDYTALIANVRGDYYVELTDYVGNFKRYPILYAEESSEPYYEALSMASKYVEDQNLNVSIRENVSNALDNFLYVINNQKTGDEFEAARQPFLKAMREANAAYEKGIDCAVSLENREYLVGTFDAEFSEENYGGKVLLGDTLELRVTVAYFDSGAYRNPAAIAAAGAKNASGALRFTVKLLYNGQETEFGSPVKIYLGIPSRYQDISLAFTGTDGVSSAAEMQAGAEWVTFTVGAAGSYDLFFREDTADLDYLWFLTLLLPLGGAAAFFVIRFRRMKARSKGTPADAPVPSETTGEAEPDGTADTENRSDLKTGAEKTEAGNENAAAGNANAAAGKSNAAAKKSNAAAKNANAAAGKTNVAEGNANSAAGKSNVAEGNANSAAGKSNAANRSVPRSAKKSKNGRKGGKKKK